MAEVSLELKEIKKSFTEGEAVLDNISLEISKGEFITLLGSSGCGKTTTLRIIAGLEQPDAGSVWLNGREGGKHSVWTEAAKSSQRRDQKESRTDAGTGAA